MCKENLELFLKNLDAGAFNKNFDQAALATLKQEVNNKMNSKTALSDVDCLCEFLSKFNNFVGGYVEDDYMADQPITKRDLFALFFNQLEKKDAKQFLKYIVNKEFSKLIFFWENESAYSKVLKGLVSTTCAFQDDFSPVFRLLPFSLSVDVIKQKIIHPYNFSCGIDNYQVLKVFETIANFSFNKNLDGLGCAKEILACFKKESPHNAFLRLNDIQKSMCLDILWEYFNSELNNKSLKYPTIIRFLEIVNMALSQLTDSFNKYFSEHEYEHDRTGFIKQYVSAKYKKHLSKKCMFLNIMLVTLELLNVPLNDVNYNNILKEYNKTAKNFREKKYRDSAVISVVNMAMCCMSGLAFLVFGMGVLGVGLSWDDNVWINVGFWMLVFGAISMVASGSSLAMSGYYFFKYEYDNPLKKNMDKLRREKQETLKNTKPIDDDPNLDDYPYHKMKH